MNGIKNFAISFVISLIIFGLIAFIIVKFTWPSSPTSSKPTEPPSATDQADVNEQ